MSLHLKLSTVLVSVLVLSALAPIEVTEAANPFSLQRLKDFLKSVIQLASSQQHHDGGMHDLHHPPEHHHQHRVMPTMATTPLAEHLSQLSREELEDLLEAQLQEVQSRNDTNETLDDDLASNRTEGYDAENSTIGYNETVGYNTTTTGTEPPEEKSKPEEKSREGSKSTSSKGSKSHPRRAHEEGVNLGSRPCNHYYDFGRSEPPRKWRKIYEYGQRVYATMERPTTEPEEESEPETTKPSEIEPASTEPSEIEPATTEPSEIEPATTEPSEIELATTEPNVEPIVTSETQQRKLKSYMYVQRNRAEYNMVEVQTPHTGTTVVYIPMNRNGTFGRRYTVVCSNALEYNV